MLQPNTLTKLTTFVTLRRITATRSLNENRTLRTLGSFLRVTCGARDAKIGPRDLERVVRHATRVPAFAGAYIRLLLTLHALRVADGKERSEIMVDLRTAFA